MKKVLIYFIILIVLAGCFEPPDITPPLFVPKSPPDSLIEHGIDAHPDNAIYLEWEEPATADEEGILSYYIYRATYKDGEYNFKYHDEVTRDAGVIFKSNSYVDYDASIDSTYAYYIRSHNDFTNSSKTSDTASYTLRVKPTLTSPSGDISSESPIFMFTYKRYVVERINYFYLRLYYLENGVYNIVYFTKTFKYSFSNAYYNIYLNNNSQYTLVLYNNLTMNDQNEYILKSGNYRWRVDAVSGELGGAPEQEGSESEWIYFTVN